MVERSKIGLVAFAAMLAACDVDFVSESRRVAFSAEQFHFPGLRWQSGGTVAVGSELCLHYQGWSSDGLTHSEPSNVLDDCYEWSAEGVARLEDGCLSLEEPGQTTLRLQRSSSSCPAELVDDEVVVRAVAPEGLHTTVEYWVEDFTQPEGWTREELTMAPGEAVPVVEGTPVTLPLGLRTIDTDELTAWTHGGVPVSPADSDSEPFEQSVRVELGPGERQDVSIRVGGIDIAPVTLESVPQSSLRDFELLLFRNEELPGYAALRAFARDEQGRPVRGVPVQWHLVEGAVDLSPADDSEVDYTLAEFECHEPGEEPAARVITVEATFGGEVHSVTWEEAEVECSAVEAEPVGCGCSSTDSRPQWPRWTLLGMVVAAIRPRRRGFLRVKRRG